VDIVRLGSVVRSLRIRKRLTQDELARLAAVPRTSVSRFEHGTAEGLSIGTVRRICAALEIRLELELRWRGGDLDRLLNARHAAMAEAMSATLGRCGGWVLRPEVSFSIYGERGVIDFVAWHPARRALLLIELKTELVDIGDLMATADRRRRLAPRIGRDLGWNPVAIGTWVALSNVSMNSRRIREHATVLRAAFPAQGRAIGRWLRDPVGPISALSLVALPQGANGRLPNARRVVKPRPGRIAVAQAGPELG
jgi:DNA-binding Xre family transcriptional regulator